MFALIVPHLICLCPQLVGLTKELKKPNRTHNSWKCLRWKIEKNCWPNWFKWLVSLAKLDMPLICYCPPWRIYIFETQSRWQEKKQSTNKRNAISYVSWIYVSSQLKSTAQQKNIAIHLVVVASFLLIFPPNNAI